MNFESSTHLTQLYQRYTQIYLIWRFQQFIQRFLDKFSMSKTSNELLKSLNQLNLSVKWCFRGKCCAQSLKISATIRAQSVLTFGLLIKPKRNQRDWQPNTANSQFVREKIRAIFPTVKCMCPWEEVFVNASLIMKLSKEIISLDCEAYQSQKLSTRS